MSGFGDYDPDDALDTEPADAEQVARKLQRLRVLHELSSVEWEGLSDRQRERALLVAVALLAWLRRQGAS